MSIRDNILDDPTQLLTTIFSLIDDEKKRMASCNLINSKQWTFFYNPIKNSIMKNAEQKRDWRVVTNQLSSLHNLLKSIKLPGDFEKYAEEEFYIVLDLPYEDKKEECPECEKEKEEEEEIIGMGRGGSLGSGPNPECPFKEDEEEEENVQDILADAINVHLKKIAKVLGDKGDHEAAYMVERTIRSINREAENGKLLGNK